MGNWQSFETWKDPMNMPVTAEPPTFDPHYGFKGQRKERVMIATEQELRACRIPKEYWDYCAHKRLEVERCAADNFPLMYRCKVQIHDHNECQMDDWIMRMKEYERERRLIQRRKRRQEKGLEPMPVAA